MTANTSEITQAVSPSARQGMGTILYPGGAAFPSGHLSPWRCSSQEISTRRARRPIRSPARVTATGLWMSPG